MISCNNLVNFAFTWRHSNRFNHILLFPGASWTQTEPVSCALDLNDLSSFKLCHWSSSFSPIITVVISSDFIRHSFSLMNIFNFNVIMMMKGKSRRSLNPWWCETINTNELKINLGWKNTSLGSTMSKNSDFRFSLNKVTCRFIKSPFSCRLKK